MVRITKKDGEGLNFVLAGIVGSYFLGIIIHCHQSGFEGGPSLYPTDPSIWNRRVPSPFLPASKR